jgi:hypothetical protein
MHRKRSRKILAACARSVTTTIRVIDTRVLMRCQMKLRELHSRLHMIRYGLEYDGSPDDIFIVTYPKSGTTWLQMIVYQLTSDGAMDFAHIDEISPFLEITMMPRGVQISDLLATPRVVKSHLNYDQIPKGPGRYIYGVRNGLDVVVSYHHHARNWLAPLSRTSMGEFFGLFMAGEVPYGSWFEHAAGWLRNKDRLNVLVVTYEELSANLEAGVKRIADFLGITIDPAAMPRILERCSFAFMREHDAKFSAEWLRPPEARRAPAGPAPAGPTPAGPAPAGPAPAFIRQGKVGGGRQELDAQSMSDFQKACDRRLRGLDEDMFRVLSGRGAREGEPAL